MKAIGKFIKSNLTVRQYAPNHMLIETAHGIALQSYKSIIVFIPVDEDIIYLGRDWDYSRTTGKYRNQFLDLNKKELEERIKDGRAVVVEHL